MKSILTAFLFCFSVQAADAISITLDKNALTVTATIDAAGLKAEYAAKKTATGKTDAELRGYRDTLIIDAVIEALKKARAAAEQTDAERQADLAVQKARLDAEYAARSVLKPIIEVKP